MLRRTPPSCRSAASSSLNSLRANPEHRGSSRVSPASPSLRLVPRFLRLLFPTFSFRRAFSPSPSLSHSLSLSLSQNPITPRATSYVQQPNPHTRTRRYPPARSNRFRVCCLWIFVSRFFSFSLRLSFDVVVSSAYRLVG